MRWMVLALCVACGAPIQDDATLSEHVPPSDRDPLPYTPPPASSGETDATIALAASGGEDQARQMLPALLRAVRDSDEAALERLLEEEVGAVAGHHEARGQPRSIRIERMLVQSRRGVIPLEMDVDELVDLSNVRVVRAAEFWNGRPMPFGVRAADLVVDVPLLEPGRLPLRAVIGWNLRGHIVVRPGRDPRIVAL